MAVQARTHAIYRLTTCRLYPFTCFSRQYSSSAERHLHTPAAHCRHEQRASFSMHAPLSLATAPNTYVMTHSSSPRMCSVNVSAPSLGSSCSSTATFSRTNSRACARASSRQLLLFDTLPPPYDASDVTSARSNRRHATDGTMRDGDSGTGSGTGGLAVTLSLSCTTASVNSTRHAESDSAVGRSLLASVSSLEQIT